MRISSQFDIRLKVPMRFKRQIFGSQKRVPFTVVILLNTEVFSMHLMLQSTFWFCFLFFIFFDFFFPLLNVIWRFPTLQTLYPWRVKKAVLCLNDSIYESAPWDFERGRQSKRTAAYSPCVLLINCLHKLLLGG